MYIYTCMLSLLMAYIHLYACKVQNKLGGWDGWRRLEVTREVIYNVYVYDDDVDDDDEYGDIHTTKYYTFYTHS